jgi:hypothetical protein
VGGREDRRRKTIFPMSEDLRISEKVAMIHASGGQHLLSNICHQ